MKKYIICIVILSICLVGALALMVYIENDKNYVIERLEKEESFLQSFYLTQINMSNYVTEHYDGIIDFSNELTADFDYEHDDTEIDIDKYKDLMDKYDLSDFYKYTDDGSSITVLSNNTVKFQYCAIIFVDYDDIRAFSFNVENDKVVFKPYLKVEVT